MFSFVLISAPAAGQVPEPGAMAEHADGAEISSAHAAHRWEAVLEQQGVALVRNRRALPRAWLVSEVRAVSGKQALREIRGETREELDPRRTALVELAGAPLPSVNATSVGDTATTRSSADGHIVVDTRSGKPTFLVVSESYFPGWEATVDGNHVPIYQTDYILLGVAVPAGSHRIELHYGAPRAALGALISLFTLTLLIGMGVYAWRRRVTPGKAAPSNQDAPA